MYDTARVNRETASKSESGEADVQVRRSALRQAKLRYTYSTTMDQSTPLTVAVGTIASCTFVFVDLRDILTPAHLGFPHSRHRCPDHWNLCSSWTKGTSRCQYIRCVSSP